MKLTLNILEKGDDDAEKRRPLSHLFGGRIRTSTVVLIVAFLALWWVYDTYRPPPAPKPPAPQVVPPGFVPDPNYTWVPRTRVQEPSATPTTTPTTTTPPPAAVTTTTPPPPFVLPTLPCIPPFCTPSPTPSPSQLPLPGLGPAPTPAPPAG